MLLISLTFPYGMSLGKHHFLLRYTLTVSIGGEWIPGVLVWSHSSTVVCITLATVKWPLQVFYHLLLLLGSLRLLASDYFLGNQIVFFPLVAPEIFPLEFIFCSFIMLFLVWFHFYFILLDRANTFDVRFYLQLCNILSHYLSKHCLSIFPLTSLLLIPCYYLLKIF